MVATDLRALDPLHTATPRPYATPGPHLKSEEPDIATSLHELGAEVTVTDPAALDGARQVHPQLHYVADRDTALRGAHAVVLATEWTEYLALDPARASALVSGRLIVDGRNRLDPAAWRAQGWAYRGLGRP